MLFPHVRWLLRKWGRHELYELEEKTGTKLLENNMSKLGSSRVVHNTPTNTNTEEQKLTVKEIIQDD